MQVGRQGLHRTEPARSLAARVLPDPVAASNDARGTQRTRPLRGATGKAMRTPAAAWAGATAWAQRRPVAAVVAAFLAYKLAVLFAAYILVAVPDPSWSPERYVHDLSVRWDGAHYLTIARHGYDARPELQVPFAFPPLFPWVVKAVGAHDLAPFFVSNVASLGAVALVTMRMGLRGGLFFALFPTWAAFSSFGYTESLFVLLAATAFLLLHRRHFAYAGLFTGLSVLTRYGAAVPFAATLHALWRRPRRAQAEYLLTAGAFAVALAAFFQFRAGGLSAYWEAQEPWGAGTVWPWEQVRFYLDGWFAPLWPDIHPSHWLLRNYAFLAVSATGTWFLLRRPEDRTLGLYGLLTCAFVATLVGTPAISMPRLLLIGFPAIAVLGERLRGPESWFGYAAFAFLGSCWVVVTHITSFFA